MRRKTFIFKYIPVLQMKSVFIKYFAIFLILFIIPVITGGTILYLNAVNKYKTEVSSYSTLLLEQTSQVINQKLSDVYQTIYSIALNDSVIEYLTYFKKDEFYNLKQYYIWNELNKAQTTSDIIEDIVLYNLKDDVVISSRGGTFAFKRFFEEIYSFDRMDMDKWKKQSFK